MDSMSNSKIFNNGMAPTASLELVLVGRPFKVLSFLCNGLSVFLMIVASLSSRWMETDHMRAGLWEECRRMPQNYTDGPIILSSNTTDMICDTQPLRRGYSLVCAILSIIAIVLGIASTAICGSGMMSKELRHKFRLYNATLITQVLSTICFLVPLITYPIKFMQLVNASVEHRVYGIFWECGWPYGIGWAAIIFLVASTLLLYLDKPSEELVYREKVYRACRLIEN